MKLCLLLPPACLALALGIYAQTAEPEVRPAIPEPEAGETAPPRVVKAIPVDEEPAAEAKAVPADEPAAEVRAVPMENDDEPKEVRGVPAEPVPQMEVPVVPAGEKKISIDVTADPSARNVSLLVPAPRGQIVDRFGNAFAQVKMSAYLGVQLPLQGGLTDQQVLDAARGPVAYVQRTVPGGWDMSDDRVLDHYKRRRWVPMLAIALLPDDLLGKIREHLPAGVILRPYYVRTYPHGESAGHLLYGMQKTPWAKKEKEELLPDEWFFPPTVGAGGLEKRFDAELTGKPGRYSSILNAKGEKLTEEWRERPQAGHTVVTTLDMEFQKICEDRLHASGRRGGIVVMDVNTGDLVAVASNPGYDPNVYVHGVSSDAWNALLNHKSKPLIPRAIQAAYPPASTFKPITALAALESGKVDGGTYFDCPKGMKIGNRWMKNHSSYDEGPMNVIRAIKRSCNPWFWQAARACGAANLCTMASRFGFGEKTGICVPDMESAGFMPTPDTYAKDGLSIDPVTRANIAIGQGLVSATALQVAQMMAAIGRGDAVPRPRLVSHIQDLEGKIVQSFPPSVRTMLTIDKTSLDLVRRGLRAVVADGDGTGKRASNNYVSIVGKTGTGEWIEKEDRRVVWFAGFIPANKPEYAYAVVLEGNAGETLSGGKQAAPVVGDVFNSIYRLKKKRGDKLSKTSEDENGGEEEDEEKPARRKAKPKDEVPEEQVPVAVPAVPAQPEKKKGLLQRLFD